MKPTVYVETSLVSYLTARPSRDLVLAANQRLTLDWWQRDRPRFELYTSGLVLTEAVAGDPTAAAERLAVLRRVPQLDVPPSAEQLAAGLLRDAVLPVSGARDALHLAIAAVNGIDYLLTWNCTHLANAFLRAKIEQTCRDAGVVAPTICTPAELVDPERENDVTEEDQP